MICEVDQPGPFGPRSACNKIWACRIWLAGATPVFVRRSKPRCCASLNLMLLFFMKVSLSFARFFFDVKDTSFSPFRQLKLDRAIGVKLSDLTVLPLRSTQGRLWAKRRV